MSTILAWPTWGRYLALAACASLLGGCSLLRLGYNQADFIAAWTADDYFDLDAAQKREFKARFEHLYAWHRREQLPEYVSFLTAAKGRLQNGLKPEDVAWFVEGLKSRYRLVVNRGAADAARLLMTVTPEQLRTLQGRWDKDNRRFAREFRLEDGAAEQQRASAKRLIEQLEDWVGNLTSDQERKIAEAIRAGPSIGRLRYEDRLRRQREFLKLMELRNDPSAFAPRLRDWLLHWERGRAPAYDRLLVEWWDRRTRLLAEFDQSLTRDQRAAALHRLQDFIDDFRRLSRAAEQVTAAP